MNHRERDPLLQSDRFYPSVYLYGFLNRFGCKHLANCLSQMGAFERRDEVLGSVHGRVVPLTVARWIVASSHDHDCHLKRVTGTSEALV